MSEIILSDQQMGGVDKAAAWYHTDPAERKPYFVLSGPAGTGKTTTINTLVKKLNIYPRFAAYTGKAALVIQKTTGYQASTIHSLIYDYVTPDKAACEELYNAIHDEENPPTPADKQKMQHDLTELSKPQFVIAEDSALLGTKLLILDEVSMVNQELLDDLLSFEVPIIALGDPGQLPPIDGAGALFKGDPDVLLTEIHRQAAGNPIIQAVTDARNGMPWPASPTYDLNDRFFAFAKYKCDPASMKDICLASDQLITGKNDTRKTVNAKMRGWLGFDVQDPYPQIGERLCCWKNDKEKNLFNGLMVEVVERGELYDTYVELYIRTEIMPEGAEPMKVRALRAYFDSYYDKEAMKRVKWFDRKGNQEFDFGYCITVHKAQGSQWEKVGFLDDGLFKGWRDKAKERRQLVYTAGTRASEHLYCIKD